MMLEVVIIFLFLSLVMYVLFGGADFGAGIVELFTSAKEREQEKEIINKAIGPIWEANHIWLIIIVVILFMGFPVVYSTVSIYLHIPLTMLLVGIVLRGTAFTFRHYDAIKDKSQKYYTNIFKYSSLWTAFFFGINTGAISSGSIDNRGQTFVELYIFSWLQPFSIATGVFVVCIFAFLASVYLLGETNVSHIKKYFVRLSFNWNIMTIISGGIVFFVSEITGVNLAEKFFSNAVSVFCMILATLSVPVLWFALKKEKALISKLTAGFQVSAIIIAWIVINTPNIVVFKDGTGLDFMNSKAPDATISVLGWALLIGSVFILPSLFYLYKVFKGKKILK